MTSSLNAPPELLRPQAAPRRDAFLCGEEEAQDYFKKYGTPAAVRAPGGIWAKPGAAPLGNPVSSGGGLGLSPLAGLSDLPPPPASELSALLYTVLSQMKDFELSADLKVPVLNRDMGRKIGTRIQVVLGERGRLDAARLQFDPHWGPVSLPGPVAGVVKEIPVFGIFAVYRLLSVEMDPKNRKVTGKGAYLFVPIEKDLQGLLVEKGKIPKPLIVGPGYDLNQGLPLYSWQIADIAEQMFLKKQTEGIKEIGQSTGLDQIVPLFEQGRIEIKGNFSNEAITIGKVTLKFFPKRGGDAHRLVVEGGLASPTMKVWGLKSVEVRHARGTLSLGHAAESEGPLELTWKLNFKNLDASQLEIARLDSPLFKIENVSSDPAQCATFTLRRGLTLKNLGLSFAGGEPHLHIQEAEARQGEFQGFGVKFRSASEDKAVFGQIHFELRKGFPHFHSRISGHASGELEYTKDGEEAAWLKFKDLKGQGSIRTGLDEKEKPFFRLAGSFAAEIPQLRFLVSSSQLKGSVRTEIGDASVGGDASLTLWPDEARARLESLEGAAPLKVAGSSGQVGFRQETSQVQGWSELTARLGKAAEKIKTDMTIDVKDIGFEIRSMDVKRAAAADGSAPALEILDADIGDIRIRGDLYGQLWGRLPGGVIHPVTVPKDAKMADAAVRIGALRDFQDENGRRVMFRNIFISGEESRATLNPADQKRCGFDRQSLHAELGLFGFLPGSKEIQIEKLGKDFRVHLKNPPYLGGCLKLD